MAYETVADVINDAAGLLSLATAEAPFSSSSGHIVQLLALLKAAGRALVREHAWPQLQAEHTFSTSNGVATYDMPAGFDRYVDQTQWNRSTALPLSGPLTAQGWQTAKALSGTASPSFYFRTRGASLELYPVPTDAQTVALEYLSRYWVQSDGADAPTSDAPTADADVLWFDSRVLVHRLRRDFLEAKGFPSEAASEAYEAALAAARGEGATAPVLNLNRGRGASLPAVVLPPTGWGG